MMAYDDSDGWYEHVKPPLVSQSNDPNLDFLFRPTRLCGHPPARTYKDRCGYGPRLSLLLISTYAKVNFVHRGKLEFMTHWKPFLRSKSWLAYKYV
jgi:phospholipase C